jgi:hypothetical protein
MDLTPGRQRLLFIVIVIVLVGLGAYLISSRNSGSGGTTAAPASPGPSASGGAASATDGVPPTEVPSPTPVSTAGGAEIYQWLPFSPADLNQAVTAADKFGAAYATWSYHDSPGDYGARLKNLVTPGELPKLEASFASGDAAQQRTASQQVSTATSSVERIFTFGTGPVSITFIIAVNEQVTAKGSQPDTQTGHYNVVVEQSGSGWLVNDIELQGLGNH